jgi:hypothetical protein
MLSDIFPKHSFGQRVPRRTQHCRQRGFHIAANGLTALLGRANHIQGTHSQYGSNIYENGD